MYRFILATVLSALLAALLAAPAFAQDRCEANLVVEAPHSPWVNTTALHEALEGVPMPKGVRRVEEAMHVALMTSSSFRPEAVWTPVELLEEDMAELGFQSTALGALVMQASMQRHEESFSNEILSLAKDLRALRIEYGQNREAIRALQAPQPRFADQLGSVRGHLLRIARFIAPDRFESGPSAAERAQLRQIQELEARNQALRIDAAKLASAQSQAFSQRQMYADATAAARALVCALAPEMQFN